MSRGLSRPHSWPSPSQRSQHGGYQTSPTQAVRGRTLRSGFFSFRNLPAPEIVPPVPTPATKKSILPPVCALRPLAGSVLPIQELACQKNCAACAHASHQDVDLAACLRPATPCRLDALAPEVETSRGAVCDRRGPACRLL